MSTVLTLSVQVVYDTGNRLPVSNILLCTGTGSITCSCIIPESLSKVSDIAILLTTWEDTSALTLELHNGDVIELVFNCMKDRDTFMASLLVSAGGESITSKHRRSKSKLVLHCMECSRKFGLTRSRHQCKGCDRVVCRRCLSDRMRVGFYIVRHESCTRCTVRVQECRVDNKLRAIGLSSPSERKHDSGKDVYGFKIANGSLVAAHQRWAASRMGTWRAYLTGNPGVWRDTKTIKTLVRGGIPPSLRGYCWKTLSGCHLYRSVYPSHYYFDLLEVATKLGPRDPEIEQIDKDLKRTFPSHTEFSDESGLVPLRRILCAYAIRNRVATGYCQSMNFIVAILLLFMDEEDAFWMLCVIVERITSTEFTESSDILRPSTSPALFYYQKNLAGVIVDQAAFEALLEWKYPRITNKLMELDVQLAPLLMQWWLCLFVNTLPLEVTLRLWDAFFFEGTKVLFRAALTIFGLNESQILAANSFEEVHSILGLFCSEVEAESFIIACFDSLQIGSLPSKRIKNARDIVIDRTKYQRINIKSSIVKTHHELFGVLLPDIGYTTVSILPELVAKDFFKSLRIAEVAQPTSNDTQRTYLQHLGLSSLLADDFMNFPAATVSSEPVTVSILGRNTLPVEIVIINEVNTDDPYTLESLRSLIIKALPILDGVYFAVIDLNGEDIPRENESTVLVGQLSSHIVLRCPLYSMDSDFASKVGNLRNTKGTVAPDIPTESSHLPSKVVLPPVQDCEASELESPSSLFVDRMPLLNSTIQQLEKRFDHCESTQCKFKLCNDDTEVEFDLSDDRQVFGLSAWHTACFVCIDCADELASPHCVYAAGQLRCHSCSQAAQALE